MKEKNKIKKIDRIILAGTILLLGLTLFSFFRAVDSNTQTVSGNAVLFSFRSGNAILIDEDIEFKTPQNLTARDNLVIDLKRGVYYWKIANTLPEDIIQLTLNDNVRLRLKQSGEGYNVINSENTSLNVDIYKKGVFSGNVVLDSDNKEETAEVVYIKG